jgi:hypothetical protein
MTPKEKAVDLLDRFYNTTPNETWFNPPLGLIKQEYKSWEHAKEIAFICVDEIIKFEKSIVKQLEKITINLSGQFELKKLYWQEVKKEIENL